MCGYYKFILKVTYADIYAFTQKNRKYVTICQEPKTLTTVPPLINIYTVYLGRKIIFIKGPPQRRPVTKTSASFVEESLP